MALCAFSIASVAHGQVSPVGVDSLPQQFLPGEYFWAPDISPEGPVTIIVSLATQRAHAYRNGVQIGVSTVSTGADGHETPTGVFTILQKDADHVSNLYANAPMPFMQRLTWDGIAMHAGNLPGFPASHGCIRLPLEFAKLLYGITRIGMTVVITEQAEVPLVSAAPGILAGAPNDDLVDEGFVWEPDISPTGPVSIVISGLDQRLVVLRNGVEIGSSPIEIDGTVERTSAFTLQSVDTQGQHWLRLPLADGDEVGMLTPAEQGKGRLPISFRSLLETVLTPGTTLLVTQETLSAGSTGHVVTVVSVTEE